MQKKGLFSLFFSAKPALAIYALGNKKQEWYASVLAKEVDCTFPHIVKVLSHFKGEGLIKFSGSGRKKIIDLTEKGKLLSSEMGRMVNLLKRFEGQEAV